MEKLGVLSLLIVACSATHLQGQYRQASKSSLTTIPTWTTQIPTWTYLLDQLYIKYEDVLELTSSKKQSKDLRREISHHILGPTGMAQLSIHLHERLISPGILRTDIFSFIKNPEDLARFKGAIEETIATLKQFQAYPPDVDDSSTDGSSNPAAPLLQSLVDIYTKKDSIFQIYPLEAVAIFHPLSHFILAAANLEKDRFAYKKLLCGVRAAWDSYEKLGVEQRLNAVGAMTWDSHYVSGHHELANRGKVGIANCTIEACPEHVVNRNISGDLFLISNANYQPHGYGKGRRSDTLPDTFYPLDNCSYRESEHFSNHLDQTKPAHQHFLCILDSISGQKFVTHEKDSEYKLSQTVSSYLGTLRHLTESSFRHLVNSLDPIKSHLSECQLSPAGSVQVTIVQAELSLEKGAYDKKNAYDEKAVLPDPYVRVVVDDVEIGRTTVKNNTLTPLWLESFEVDKVYSWSDVRVEVYDRDVGEGDKDDSLGGIDLELINLVGALRETFYVSKEDFGFGRITVGVKYSPHNK